MNEWQARLAALSPHERARLLTKLKHERQAASASVITRVDRSAPLPLSFAQRRLWFLERLEGRSAAYNMPAAFRLRGALDPEAVIGAIAEIVRRHDVLRTRLIDHDGEPLQVVDLPETGPVGARTRTVTLAQEPTARQEGREGREDALRAILREEAQYVFDLSREHPIRSVLIACDQDEHVLVVTLHHIASDGWSTGVLVAEFAALYNAFREHRTTPLADLPIQYADFAAWQRGELDDQQKMAPQLEYWRHRLDGAPGSVNLPSDFPRGLHPGVEGDSVYFRIDAGLAASVNAFAREAGASAYMVMLAAFFVLLHRWSGDTDLTVGSPIANRPRKEVEGLIGFFVNTLALRVTLDDDPDFRTLVTRVRNVALDAFAHADLPFERLVEQLNPERRLDQSPFFQLMFAMQSGTAAPPHLDGVRIEPLPITTGAARLDLTLSLQETPDGLNGCLEFSTALFRVDTAQRFAEHYRSVVGAALRAPEMPVSRLDILSHGERHRLLVEWNRTDTPADRSLCLHQLVEEQARRTPDAIAVRFQVESWTYRRLLDASERVARALQQQGVGPDVLVGVCMDRTPEMIAALLGVLRAGGAYVALDPNYPAGRNDFILSDSGASIVLRNGDVDAAPIGTAPLRPLSVQPENLAYVLYTSGSTGRPKGVAIEHRSPVALIHWARSVWTLDELRGVLAGTSICFDLSVFEIFLPLSVGGAVILAGNVLDLPALEFKNEVTLVNTVPSAIDALLAQNGLPASVRVVNLAGEPLTTELADRVYDVPTVAKVYDLYGPSEDTTYSTFTLRTPGDAPSIGRPIANTRLYILDAAMQPMPAGLPGEIYLGGEGLARGYLGRPDLTSERFVPNPFVAGDRLYRTGDLARFRSDGVVEFLGRRDHQIKLRGFRIELGEIEGVLREFPGVVGGVATLQRSKAGSAQLTAHVAHPGGSPIAPALHAHLRARLPDYMVPPVLVILDALPLTPNGKIDRQALPMPDQRETTRMSRPLASDERRLAGVWTSLLRVDAVTAHDDFFRLGGHSLLAARLTSKITDAFAVVLPLRAIFEYPTLGAQAAEIARLQTESPSAPAPIPILGFRERLPLSFAQERLWFLDQLEPGSTAYNMAGAVRLIGHLDIAALQAAFTGIIDRHEVLRTVFPTIDGRAWAEPVGQRRSLREIDVRATTPPEQRTCASVDAFLRSEAQRPFALASDALIRATVLRIDDTNTVLAVTMHHIVSDGWSIDLFLNEWCARYAAAVSGRAFPSDLHALQYADFASWQRRRWDDGAMTPHVEYWRSVLASAPRLLDLPTDRPRPDAQSYAGATHAVAIDGTLAALLAERTREFGVTSFMALAAVFAVSLNRWCGQGDIVIGFPAAGRHRSDLEALIGMFVNTVPLRVRVDMAPTFEALLAQVRASTLDALSHQDLPFEKLVDAVGVERHLAWSPLFQVMFLMQHAQAVRSLPEGLRAEPIALPASTSTKFDLTLAITEEHDQLKAAFEYDMALFDAATIERFAGDFRRLLGELLRDPALNLAVSRTSVLPPPSASHNRSSSAERPARIDESTTAVKTPAEEALVDIWSQVLRLDSIRMTDNFFELGGDSIVSIRIIAAMRERGWRIEPKQIFRHQTIRALAAVARSIGASAEAIEDGTGDLPLTPMQRLFFAMNPPTPDHFNQALLLDIDPGAFIDTLREALRETQRAHPALRSRFHRDGGSWRQEIVHDVDVVLDEHDLSTVPAATRVGHLERICDDTQRRLDLRGGPVFRAVVFRIDDERARLLLVAHHLVVDAVSWPIMLEDLVTACAQIRKGERPALPPEHCGPRTFRRRIAAQFSGVSLNQESAYWARVLEDAGDVLRGPAGFDGGLSRPVTITRALSDAETRTLVTDGHRAYHATVVDLLLAAIGRALSVHAGRDTVLIDVEGHGRGALDDADLSRSVDWFTSLYPVALPCGESNTSRLIRAVAQSTTSVPRGGVGFGWSQWTDGTTAAPPRYTDVCFNYLGQVGADATAGLIRGIAPESAGRSTADDLPRRYRLECNVAIVNGSLVWRYSFDAASLAESTVVGLADLTMATLRAFIANIPRELDSLLGDLDLSDVPES